MVDQETKEADVVPEAAPNEKKKTLFSALFAPFARRAEKRRAERAKREAEELERDRRSKIGRFRSTVGELKRMQDVISVSAMAAIESFETDAGGDPDALGAFADDKQIEDLLTYARSRRDFIDRDRQRFQPHFTFVTDADDLFNAIGYSTADPILKAISKKYMLSNAGNVIGGGLMAGRKNYGGAVAAVADAARVGHHNGMAQTTFTHNIKYLAFNRGAADLTELHRRYIIYAYRLRYMSIGDRSVVGKALFSLVYDNGTATPQPPTPHNKFTDSLYPEFHNNFMSHMWTVKQAASHLDTIRGKSDYNERLFNETDVSKFMRDFRDFVPKPRKPGNSLTLS